MISSEGVAVVTSWTLAEVPDPKLALAATVAALGVGGRAVVAGAVVNGASLAVGVTLLAKPRYTGE